VHGWHYGRYGWWWTGPGFWYWYPAPVYYNYNYASPPPPDSALAPETSPTWYYCDSAKAYFPYVGSCAVPWRAVPATAPSKDGGTPPAPPSPTKS
jgi:hypothetical protein